MPAVVNLSSGPFPAGSTPEYTSQIVKPDGTGISSSELDSVTLSIVDTMTEQVINGVAGVDILNTGRGKVDDKGNLTISLLPGDTSMTGVPGSTRVQRSLVIDFVYNTGNSVGRHQANFWVLSLAGR